MTLNLKRGLVEVGHPRLSGLWIALALPYLAFPNQLPAAAIIAIPALLAPPVAAALTGQPVWPRTPFTWPCVTVMIALGMAFAVSPFKDVSLPKFTGIVLGLSVFRAIALTVDTPRALRWGAVGYLLIAGTLSVAGLSGAAPKNQYLAQGSAPLLSWLGSLPGTGGAVNPNAVGGTVLFALPMLLVLLGRRYGSTALVAASALSLSVVLLLTESRTAWAALGLTMLPLLLIACWRRSRAWGVLVMMGIAATVVVFAQSITAAASVSYALRYPIWRTAIFSIQDFPLTGVGLNAFRRVAPLLYPLPSATPPDLVHAHNVFLQTALDLGVPGLVGYVALLVTALKLTADNCRWRPDEAPLAVGLAASLVAIHLFGMTDAIALGAKVGILLWINLGLVAAAHTMAFRARLSDSPVGAR